LAQAANQPLRFFVPEKLAPATASSLQEETRENTETGKVVHGSPAALNFSP